MHAAVVNQHSFDPAETIAAALVITGSVTAKGTLILQAHFLFLCAVQLLKVDDLRSLSSID